MLSSKNFCEDFGKLCADFLGGVWSDIEAKDIRIKALSGGMSNEVFLCSVPSAIKTTVAGEPRHVLFRLYGSRLKDDPNRLTRDAVVFALLAERKLGPRLYGIFPGGRLEEYIPCRTLRPHELSNPHISLNVAAKMARLHAINMPLCKKPRWLFDNMREWLDEITVAYDEQSGLRESNSADWALLDQILRMELSHEIDTLEDAVLRNADRSFCELLPQVVFCHNDLQGGNILLSQHPSKQNPQLSGKPSMENSTPNLPLSNDLLTFIDYEYSSYNYRSFDIANHFMEWTFDYSRKEAPYFRYEPQKWPSKEQQLTFIQCYLKTAAPEIFGSNGSESVQDDIRVVDQYTDWFLSSVRLHSMSSHLLYSVWALAQFFSSSIRFGYLDYASTRLSSYFEERRCNLLS